MPIRTPAIFGDSARINIIIALIIRLFYTDAHGCLRQGLRSTGDS